MKSKSWEVELPYDWETLILILSEPEKTLPFFPYFEKFERGRVKFKVPRFIFNFGYEFELDVGIGRNEVIYTFRGDKGILTVTFKMIGRKLRVTASWAGFGETFMGKPLENFAKGIAEAIREFCSSMACPVVRFHGSEGEVEHITPETAPALVKRVAMEFGKDFILEGEAEDGTYLAITVKDGNLKELRVRQGMKESVIEADIPVIELGKELFEGLPLDKKFKIRAKKL
ncbi:STK_08120 family protein [Thermococcus sp.]|uniref:STK_08120 family protein n=1 Tax=Thermococcus sp. TaxID=35749 RepID=UPI002635FA2D|nr:STK_08120 family protein [Thermococcus sp.]